MQTALEMYANDHNGNYPNIWVVICETNPSNHAALQAALAPYIPTLPYDPDPSGDCSTWGRRYVVGSSLTDYKVIAHNLENPAAMSRSAWDPARDSGSNGSIVDGSTPWAFAVYTPGLATW